jgi:hypothetical protein
MSLSNMRSKSEFYNSRHTTFERRVLVSATVLGTRNKFIRKVSRLQTTIERGRQRQDWNCTGPVRPKTTCPGNATQELARGSFSERDCGDQFRDAPKSMR